MSSRFELLPNETIMDMYEYLDIFDIMHSFSNLNSRFNSLINDSRIYVSLDLSSAINDIRFDIVSREILPQISHRLISLIIAEKSRILAFSLMCNNSSFHSLQILSLIDIEKSNNLKTILEKLPLLLCLSIKTNKIDNEITISEICSMSLAKLTLKKCLLNFCNQCIFKDLLITSNIKQLTIGWCSMSELIVLFRHLPYLRILHVRYLFNYDYSVTVLNDTNLVIKELNLFLYGVPYNNIELLLRCMPLLKMLTIRGQLDDLTYTDSQQWETVFSSSLLLLRVFNINFTPREELLNSTPSQNSEGRWYELLSPTQISIGEQKSDDNKKQQQKKKKCRGNRKAQHLRRRERRDQQIIKTHGEDNDDPMEEDLEQIQEYSLSTWFLTIKA
ncbi:unnamed protein product [Didymodactylos carnosus]|uniref:F-box domain-containing protein n=1 Tax=Didymodactylos carnosus TaxID=1234261 RepID=A0A814PBB7_9BILA|nr:unnamed protein product [Didymodactylos carnosus]CAF1102999.1 unnamed protein product [Didymodactylos carnosus]CAF3800065.1 unnamed protein product [Didymodactylos carnosus]CAF3867738.1 unnamed protein product [Didymodactylos carnosus]